MRRKMKSIQHRFFYDNGLLFLAWWFSFFAMLGYVIRRDLSVPLAWIAVFLMQTLAADICYRQTEQDSQESLDTDRTSL